MYNSFSQSQPGEAKPSLNLNLNLNLPQACEAGVLQME